MNKEKFRLLLKRYLDGNCTDDEKRIIDRWYELLDQEEFKAPSGLEMDLVEKRLWNKIQAGALQPHEPVKSREREGAGSTRKLNYRMLAAAALIGLIVMATAYFWWSSGKGLVSPTGGQAGPAMASATNTSNSPLRISLTDGTTVILAAHAAINYPNTFEQNRREVFLDGEAFFDVARDTSRPFFVYSPNLVTQVLGTSFSVKTDKKLGQSEVAVTTGIVSVYERDEKESRDTRRNGVILTPNQKVLYYSEDKHFITGLVDDPLPVKGRAPAAATDFQFNDAPLSTVLNALEDTYGIKFVVENEGLYHCPFTGNISRQSLGDKLKLITQSIGASYEIQGTQILIKGQGCE